MHIMTPIRMLAALLGAAIFLTGTAEAATCGEMTRRLARLRLEYRNYVTSPQKKAGDITFDGLAEILDKIVALKAEMQKVNCKIPPRPNSFQGKD